MNIASLAASATAALGKGIAMNLAISVAVPPVFVSATRQTGRLEYHLRFCLYRAQ